MSKQTQGKVIGEKANAERNEHRIEKGEKESKVVAVMTKPVPRRWKETQALF